MSSKISFGPTDQEWHYSPATKTYDLSRGSAKKLTVQTTEGPKDISFSVSPESTALVIVDMQNFFLDEKCMAHPNGLKAVDPTIKVIEKCRETGVQVIWMNWGLTDNDMETLPAGVRRGFMKDVLLSTDNAIKSYTGLGSDLGDGKGRCLFAGSWNADIYPPLKQSVKSEDLHCAKNRMSGLWSPEQPLWKTLKEKKMTTLLFAGVNTDQCVLGTFVDGYNAGWDCIMVADTCGTTTPGAKEVTFYNVANNYGFVTDSASFVKGKVE